MKIAVVDNYDSFTFNLVQRLGEIDDQLEMVVFRNDELAVDDLVACQPTHLILSPGPCTPNEAGISVECVQRLGSKIPLLGVCLGHQSIGQALGGTIVRANRLMHGKTDEIHHNEQGLFAGLPNPLVATRYHSLMILPESLPEQLEVTAWAEEPDGTRVIMGIQHRDHPLFGVQFHPESFLCEDGHALLSNFLKTDRTHAQPIKE